MLTILTAEKSRMFTYKSSWDVLERTFATFQYWAITNLNFYLTWIQIQLLILLDEISLTLWGRHREGKSDKTFLNNILCLSLNFHFHQYLLQNFDREKGSSRCNWTDKTSRSPSYRLFTEQLRSTSTIFTLVLNHIALNYEQFLK